MGSIVGLREVYSGAVSLGTLDPIRSFNGLFSSESDSEERERCKEATEGKGAGEVAEGEPSSAGETYI